MTPEETYKAETGKEARETGRECMHILCPFLTSYTDDFVQWLKARLEKAEKQRDEFIRIGKQSLLCDPDDQLHYLDILDDAITRIEGNENE